jgi:hypothetical protein
MAAHGATDGSRRLSPPSPSHCLHDGVLFHDRALLHGVALPTARGGGTLPTRVRTHHDLYYVFFVCTTGRTSVFIDEFFVRVCRRGQTTECARRFTGSPSVGMSPGTRPSCSRSRVRRSRRRKSSWTRNSLPISSPTAMTTPCGSASLKHQSSGARGSGGPPLLSRRGRTLPCRPAPSPRWPVRARHGGGLVRWRTSAVEDQCGGPRRWWPADGPRPVLIFFFFLFVVRLNSGARRRMFNAVSKTSHRGAVS